MEKAAAERLTQNLDHQHPGAQHDGDEAEDLAQAVSASASSVVQRVMELSRAP